MTNAMSNKEAAVAFLQMSAAGQVDDAFARFAAPDFCHHNPWYASDAASLQAGMRENAARFPHKRLELLRAIADGALVALHSRVRMQADGPALAVVHILRFEDGRIAEMWDLGQAEPENMANQLGMF